MTTKYLLPVLAALALLFAVRHVVEAQKPSPEPPPPISPAQSPFKRNLAGAGIIEAATENIAIGTTVPGIVAEVFVHKKFQIGDQLAAGTPLFRIDDRQLQADLNVKRSNLKAAQAALARLRSLPRQEDVPVAEARVNEAEENLLEQQDAYKRVLSLKEKNVAVEGEVIRWRQNLAVANKQLDRAKAELALLLAGAWKCDLEVSQAAVDQAQAAVDMVQTELARLTVTAPIDGEVLQCNVRPGEFVGTPPNQPLVVMGDLQHLHVRVDIDENDIPRFRPGHDAEAVLRGDPKTRYALKFVRVEPYVIPKKSLTGDNTERVDTRVLQVLYDLQPKDKPVYVGQQVDVFINEDAPQ